MTGAASIVLLPGTGVRCTCGDPASTFARCAVCERVHARCGGCGEASRAAADCCDAPPWEDK